MWREIKAITESKNRFLITTHVNPDGDGIGSAVALLEFLLSFNKEARFVVDSPIPDRFSFLDFHSLFRLYDGPEAVESFDVLVVLDTSRQDRIGRMKELFSREGILSICIDHHPLCTPVFTPHAVIDPQACATGAMIYSLFKESGLPFNKRAAMGLYTSVISDTGRFSYASTSRKAHKIADECLKVGVDPSEMFNRLFQQVPKEQILIFQRAFSRMGFYFDHQLALLEVHFRDYEEFLPYFPVGFLQDFDMIHEFNKAIRGVLISGILWELPDSTTRVSLRSNSHLEIVQAMKQIGGGGHPNAAGALVNASFEEVKQQVLALLETTVSLSLSLKTFNSEF